MEVLQNVLGQRRGYERGVGRKLKGSGSSSNYNQSQAQPQPESERMEKSGGYNKEFD